MTKGVCTVSIKVHLDVFEGPLDLLLHLIEKNKMNIYDIPIAEVTDQFLEYIHQAEEQDLEVMSEFLVMAATLLQIKSRMLLPVSLPQKEEEEDPREELVAKLLEYKMYKQLSLLLKQRESKGQQVLYKPPTYPEGLQLEATPLSPNDILDHISLQQIYNAFQDVIKRNQAKIDPIRHDFGSISKEVYTIEQKVEWIYELLMVTPVVYFEDLFYADADRVEIIVTFLALLELIKQKKIKISQEQIFDPIQIRRYKETESGRML